MQTVPTGFGPLHDQGISTGVQRVMRLIDIVHLDNDPGIGPLNGFDERTHIAKR